MTTPDLAQQWDQLWLPLYPLASDDLLQGVYRDTRARALERRYVEANPQALSNLLVVDVDDPHAVLVTLDASGSHPMPTAVVENPQNGHAHAVWALAEPVTRTEYARRKPLAYAAAVTEGLRRAVDGDRGYSGLMTKNPTHRGWTPYWISDELRSLDQLAAGLGTTMPPRDWRRRRDPVGLGRNCALFESARHWAYREVRHHWGDPDGLAAAIQQEAERRNVEFSEPLPASEVKAIASSISRWIIRRSRIWSDGPAVYEATFSTIQAARGRKGGNASATSRRAAAEQLRSTLLDQAQE